MQASLWTQHMPLQLVCFCLLKTSKHLTRSNDYFQSTPGKRIQLLFVLWFHLFISNISNQSLNVTFQYSLSWQPRVMASFPGRCVPYLWFCGCIQHTICLSPCFTDNIDSSHFLFSTTERQTFNISSKGMIKITVLRRSSSVQKRSSIIRQTRWGSVWETAPGAPSPISF